MLKDLEPLWKIEDELQALLDSDETCQDELRSELQARLARYVTAEVEKVDRIGHVLSSLDDVQFHARAEIERLQQRRQSAEKAAGRLEQYLLRILEQRGGRPLKGHTVTLSVRRTEALAIVAPELVPERFKRTTVVVDIPKTPVREALKAGEEIPGVMLQVNEHLVRK